MTNTKSFKEIVSSTIIKCPCCEELLKQLELEASNELKELICKICNNKISN